MAINIELIKSLNGRSDKQVATAMRFFGSGSL